METQNSATGAGATNEKAQEAPFTLDSVDTGTKENEATVDGSDAVSVETLDALTGGGVTRSSAGAQNVLGRTANTPRTRENLTEKKRDELWGAFKAKNPGASVADFDKSMGYVKMINKLYDDQQKRGYQLSLLVTTYIEDKLWESLGLETFAEWVSDKELCPFGRSSAFRYQTVGKFMDELDLMDAGFDDSFYDEQGIERKIHLNEDGTVNEAATAEANKVTKRVRFMDMAAIASAHNRGKITTPQAKELMGHAMVISPENFKLKMKEIMGEENPESTDEKLWGEGLTTGPVLVLPAPLFAPERRSDLASHFEELARQAREGGELIDGMAAIISDDETVETLGKKGTTFKKVGGTIYGVVR